MCAEMWWHAANTTYEQTSIPTIEINTNTLQFRAMRNVDVKARRDIQWIFRLTWDVLNALLSTVSCIDCFGVHLTYCNCTMMASVLDLVVNSQTYHLVDSELKCFTLKLQPSTYYILRWVMPYWCIPCALFYCGSFHWSVLPLYILSIHLNHLWTLQTH